MELPENTMDTHHSASVCDFAPLLVNSSHRIPKECKGDILPISDLEQEEKSIILIRSGIFNVEDGGNGKNICQQHEAILSTNGFNRNFFNKKVCLWIHHGNPKPGKRRKKAQSDNIRTYVMKQADSKILLDNHQILHPTGGHFCSTCSAEIYPLLKTAKETPKVEAITVDNVLLEEEIHLPPTLGEAAQNFDDFTPPLTVVAGGGSQTPSTVDGVNQSPSTVGGSQNSDDSFQSSQEQRDKRKEYLNKFFEACKLDVQLDYLLSTSVDKASKTTIENKFNIMDYGMKAIAMTICKDENEISPFLAKYQSSKHMSAIIRETGGHYYQEPFFREILKLWQNTNSYNKLVEITSYLGQFYTLEHLLKFNR